MKEIIKSKACNGGIKPTSTTPGHHVSPAKSESRVSLQQILLTAGILLPTVLTNVALQCKPSLVSKIYLVAALMRFFSI